MGRVSDRSCHSENADAESDESKPGPDADQDSGTEPGQQLVSSASVHDLEGEGEENEETTHEIRSKVYKLTRNSDGKSVWGDMGVGTCWNVRDLYGFTYVFLTGILRLKRNKETDARRMLLRNSSTGKVTVVSINLTHVPSFLSPF